MGVKRQHIAQSVFAIDDRISYIQQSVVIEADGRVLDQTRHGVLVEFDKMGQFLASPEPLSLAQRSTTARHSELAKPKSFALNRLRRKLI